MSRTLILLAHGSRSPETVTELKELAGRLGQPQDAESGFSVVGAFLSLAEPDLAEAFRTAVAKGAREVHILPLFLFSGKHLLGDIPAQVESLRVSHPSVRVVLLEAVGRHPDFPDFLRKASGFG